MKRIKKWTTIGRIYKRTGVFLVSGNFVVDFNIGSRKAERGARRARLLARHSGLKIRKAERLRYPGTVS